MKTVVLLNSYMETVIIFSRDSLINNKFLSILSLSLLSKTINFFKKNPNFWNIWADVWLLCMWMNLCVHLRPRSRTPTILSVRQLHEWADSTFSQPLFMCCVDPAPLSTARHFNIKAKWAGPPLSRRNTLFWFRSISTPLLHVPSLCRVFPLTPAPASRVTWRRAEACRGLVSPPGPAVPVNYSAVPRY